MGRSLRSILIIAALSTLLAPIALVREMLTARVLGATPEADAFFLAYFVPDTLANMLLGTALSTAAVPVFSRLEGLRGSDLDRSVSFLCTACATAGLAGVLIVRVFVGPVTRSGVTESITAPVLVPLVKMTVFSAPFYLVAAVLVAALHAKASFGPPGYSALAFNMVYTLVLAFSAVQGVEPWVAAFRQAWAVPVSAAMMTLLLYTALWRKGSRVRCLARPDASSLQVVRGMLGPMAVAGAAIIVPLVERLAAIQMGPGNIAYLNYAYKLSQFPVWVLSGAVGTVAYPSIARALSAGGDGLKDVLRSSLGTILVVTCPVSLYFVAMREQVVALLFALSTGGPPEAVVKTMAAYSLAIVPTSVTILATKYHLTRGSGAKLMGSVMAQVLVGGIIDVAAAPRLGLHWLGISAIVASAVPALVLWPEILRAGGIPGREMLSPACASVPMLLAPAVARVLTIPGGSLPAQVVSMGGSFVLCLAISAVLGLLLRVPQATAFTRVLTKRV
jgi:putative peptidoglycan lipid II flippase